jgi:pimeloyl-ACP methyl ester carboxylesterase
VSVPLLLVRGGLSGVVGDEDVAELPRRHPSARVAVVVGAGPSIQGDRPLELASLIDAELG